jgi:amino acid adenylation domain-containing protein
MTPHELLESVAGRGVELHVEASQLRVHDGGGVLSADERAALTARRGEIVTALRTRTAMEVRHHPLSHNQRSLWFIAQEAPDSVAYNIAVTARIISPVEPSTIREALQGLVDRHPMLRTTYHLAEDGQPIQRTTGSIEVAFDHHDVAGTSEASLRSQIDADYRRPFDLERGPIFRGSLYTRAPDDHVFLMVVHHIAADGWSLGILAEDFRTLQAEAGGRPVQVAPAPGAEYFEFVEWQRSLLASAEGERLARYWQSQLRPACAPVALPADRPRPSQKTYRGATVSSRVDRELVARLRALAREQSTTLFVVLLAAFDTMLFRITGAEDLVVGTPTMGRTQPEFGSVVGHFVNPVPLRTRVEAGMTFRTLLGRVRETVHEAIAAQHYPLALMVQHSQSGRDPSRSPLFDTFFAAVSVEKIRSHGAASSDTSERDGATLRHEPYPLNQLEGQFDLGLQLAEHESSIDIEFRYSIDLFEESTVRGFVEHYLVLLRAVALEVDAPLESLGAPSSPTAAAFDDGSVEAFLAMLAGRDIRVALDGEKLRLNAPAGALDAVLKQTLAQRKPEILAALRARQRSRTPLQPVPRTSVLPISFAQQRLWVFDRMQPGTAHYNIALPLRLRGTLDQRALTRALDALMRRHESLRTCIREEDGHPRAVIREYSGTAVQFVDLSGVAPDAREAEALRRSVARAQEPFDLSRGPMAGFLLMRLTPDEHRLLICMHHIAADGWSLSVAALEICAVYDAEREGRPSPLPPLPIQYVDYAAWQREQLNSGLLATQLSYWQRELAGAPAVLELPTDRPRPPFQSFRGMRRSLRMPLALLDELKAFSRSHDATLYMTLLSGWLVLLSRYSGQEDIVIGTPMANRDQPELEPLIGCFVNNVVMRGRLEGNPRFVDFLTQVKGTVLRAFDHRDLPFDRLVEALRPERVTSHQPVFQTLFTLHSFPMQTMGPTGLQVEVVDTGEGVSSSRFDLTLEMDELADGLRLAYEYAADLFDAATIERMHGHYLTLLRHVVADAVQPVRDIPLLTPTDERRLLDELNATTLDHDRSLCVHHLVSAAAARRPDAVAIEAVDAILTYAALERRTDQLAGALRARGVGRGSLVGVCLDRTSMLPIALLGVLKAGAAYVPVDPAHPPDRLAYTLTDARVACVVTETRFTAAVAAAGVPLLLVDADTTWQSGAAAPREEDATPVDLAYVIYTSGSTGRPKGVEIEHRNLVSFLRAMQREPGIGASDVLLAVTTPSFDIAGLEMFLPLVAGARMVIASRAETLDGERLRERLDSSAATLMQATPATWRLLIDAGWDGTPGLTALCGGEAMPRDLARELMPRVDVLWNMYGPTETTIWSTVHKVTDSDRDIPIGHPIANTGVYVLDAAGRLAPPGVPGELCIGGEGVARGYRQRPELTAEKFVTMTLPGRGAERLYRTGDVVRLRGDGVIEFVGRRDHQVKLRGYRIELGEIESVLAEHPTVRRCVVIVREDSLGDQRLVAYVVATEADGVSEEALRTLLRARLPDYMVPSAIVALDELPLTPNGKVDRKALPTPRLVRAVAGSGGPGMVMTDAQRKVATIWCTVLQLESVGLHDNFFDLGGHSLLVIRVHAELRRGFGVELTVVDLFQRTTVAAQAALLSESADRNVGLERAKVRMTRQVVA